MKLYKLAMCAYAILALLPSFDLRVGKRAVKESRLESMNITEKTAEKGDPNYILEYRNNGEYIFYLKPKQ